MIPSKLILISRSGSASRMIRLRVFIQVGWFPHNDCAVTQSRSNSQRFAPHPIRRETRKDFLHRQKNPENARSQHFRPTGNETNSNSDEEVASTFRHPRGEKVLAAYVIHLSGMNGSMAAGHIQNGTIGSAPIRIEPEQTDSWKKYRSQK